MKANSSGVDVVDAAVDAATSWYSEIKVHNYTVYHIRYMIITVIYIIVCGFIIKQVCSQIKLLLQYNKNS